MFADCEKSMESAVASGYDCTTEIADYLSVSQRLPTGTEFTTDKDYHSNGE